MRNRSTGRKRLAARAVMAMMAVMLACPPAGAAKRVTLKVALLQIFDALPYYVADARGLFRSERFEVIGLPVGSAIERDQLLQAGAVDGVLNEMTTVAAFNRDAIRVVVVGTARRPVAGHPLFRLLAAPGSGIVSPEDLAGVPIAVSSNTIIEYVTDRLLAVKGLTPDEIVKQSVPVIPERYQLLVSGKIRAAVLPDPLAESAMLDGALQVLNDAGTPEFSVSVLTFSTGAVEEKPDAIRFFLDGWDRAVEAVNADPDAFRELVLKRIRVPRNIGADVSIPVFPRGAVPSAAQWGDVIDWMRGKGLVQEDVPYERSVTGAFLPVPPG